MEIFKETSLLEIIKSHLIGKHLKYLSKRNIVSTFNSRMSYRNGTTDKQRQSDRSSEFLVHDPDLKYIGRHSIFSSGLVTDVTMDDGDIVIVLDDWNDTVFVGPEATIDHIGNNTYFLDTQRYSK